MRWIWIIAVIVIVLLLIFLRGTPEESQQASLLEETRENLIGRWVSLDDDRYLLEITGDGRTIDSYDSATVEEGTYVLSDSTEGDFGDFWGGVFIIKTLEEEIFNYKILSLDEKNLEMVYLEGTGQTLRFERLIE